MKQRKTLSLLLALLMALSLFLTGCGTGEAPAEKAPEKGAAESAAPKAAETAETITLGGGDWGYPTPFAHYSRGPGSRKKALVYDTLMTSDADGKPAPMLSAEWKASEDGLSYTFKLREGVKWHDGEALTSEDVVFSYEYENKYPPVSLPNFSSIKSVEAPDEHTVKIELKEKDKKFLKKIASFVIIPKHVWENVTDPYNYFESAIGTGPYKLCDYSKEQGSYRFEAFEDFWGNRPKVKEIKFVPVSEAVLAFQQGEVDRIGLTPDILPNFENNPEFKIMQYVTSWAYRLYFNMNKRPELSDVALRQAMVYAIDRQQLVDMIQRGAAVPGNPGILHPTNKLYNPNVEQYAYNAEKAKSLLEGLGYKDADGDGVLENEAGTKLSFTLVTDRGASRLAELIQSQLSLVGIKINVQSADQKSRDALFMAGDFELCINGSGNGENFEDIANFTSAKETSSNAALIGYKNEKLDELYAAYTKETDKGELKKLMSEMQEIAAAEVPKLTLFYTNSIVVHKPAVYDGWSMESWHSDSRINYVDP